MVKRHSRQRTRAVTCSTRRPAIAAGSRSAAALTLLIRGTTGGTSAIPASAARTASAAGASSRQWNGALTASSMARPPLALARPTARSTAALAPLSTTWPGALSLATSQTPSALASAASASTASSSSPRIAAMAPSPTGTAVCIAWPRRRKSRAASSIPRLSAAASAEYSPSEWPATQSQKSASRRPLRASRVRSAASEVAISAGWAFSVSRSRSSGPSKINRLSARPRASSTCSNTWRAADSASNSARPMPTAWEPCPGKMQAVVMGGPIARGAGSS